MKPEQRRIAMLKELGPLVGSFRKKYGADVWDCISVVATSLATLTNVPTDPAMRQMAETFALGELKSRQQRLAIEDTDAVAGSA